jgi:hypothetical protein
VGCSLVTIRFTIPASGAVVLPPPAIGLVNLALHLQLVRGMRISEHLVRWGGARLSRRLSRSVPWIGAAVGLLTVASTMRRKGVVKGALDTGLNAVPLLGAAKNVVELARGKDFFPDRHLPSNH